MLLSTILLAAFAIVGTAMVVLTFDNTKERVSKNKRDYTLRKLHELIAPEEHDNNIESDTLFVSDALLGTKKPVIVYRARKNNKPVATIIQSTAPDGYSGIIEILVAIKNNGMLMGVRVVTHTETPGLGDAIDARKSGWIHQFAGKSINDPAPQNWKVKRDGGQFDQITSATITSRAVTRAVYNTLKYYQDNRMALFKRVEP